MLKILKLIILLVWIGDVLDFPQLAFLDSEIPMNTIGWLLYFWLTPSSVNNSKN